MRQTLLPLLMTCTILASVPAYAADETLTGDWNDLRTNLSDKGFDFSGSYTVNAWRNFSGGILIPATACLTI